MSVAIAFVLTASVGCASIVVDAPMTANNTVSLTSQPEAGRTMHFSKQKKVFYLLWGLVPITDNHTAKDIQEVAGDNDVVNLKVDTHFDVIDWLVGAVAGWLSVVSKTATIEGDVVKK